MWSIDMESAAGSGKIHIKYMQRKKNLKNKIK